MNFDNIIDSIKQVYYSIEEKWFAMLDRIDEVVPVYKVVTPIEDAGIPSLIVFVLIILLLMSGLFFMISAPAATQTTKVGTKYSVTLTITDQSGAPLEKVQVDVLNHVALSTQKQAFTNAEGEVKFFVEKDKTLKLSLSKSNYKSKNINIEVSKAQKESILLESARQGPSSLETKIIFLDEHTGDFIRELIDIKVTCEKDTDKEFTRRSSSSEQILFDAVKELDYTEDSCGKLVVNAVAKNYEPISWSIFAGSEEKIYMKRLSSGYGTLKVTVANETTKTLLSDIAVKVENTSSYRGETETTGSAGIVSFELGAGVYRIFAQDPKGKYVDLSIDNIIVNSSKTKELSVFMQEPIAGQIKIQLSDKNTKVPIKNVDLELYTSNKTTKLSTKKTDDKGQAFFSVPRDDTYYLNVLSPDNYALLDEFKPLTISNNFYTVELAPLTSDKRGIVEVTVIDEFEQSLEGATVSILDQNKNLVKVAKTTNKFGKVLFQGLNEKQYIVKAVHKSGQTAEQSFQVNDIRQKTNVEVQVRIGSGYIDLEVFDLKTGEPLEDANVTFFSYSTNNNEKLSGKDMITNESGEVLQVFTTGTHVFAKIEKDNYITLETAPVTVLIDDTLTVKAYLKEGSVQESSSGETFIEFISLTNEAGEKVLSTIKPDKTYKFTFYIHTNETDDIHFAFEKPDIFNLSRISSNHQIKKLYEKKPASTDTTSKLEETKWFALSFEDADYGVIHEITIEGKIDKDITTGEAIFGFAGDWNNKSFSYPTDFDFLTFIIGAEQTIPECDARKILNCNFAYQSTLLNQANKPTDLLVVPNTYTLETKILAVKQTQDLDQIKQVKLLTQSSIDIPETCEFKRSQNNENILEVTCENIKPTDYTPLPSITLQLLSQDQNILAEYTFRDFEIEERGLFRITSSVTSLSPTPEPFFVTVTDVSDSLNPAPSKNLPIKIYYDNKVSREECPPSPEVDSQNNAVKTTNEEGVIVFDITDIEDRNYRRIIIYADKQKYKPGCLILEQQDIPDIPIIEPDESTITLCGEDSSTGLVAKPKVKLDWEWENISWNECDKLYNGIFCDGTQFTISILKRIEILDRFLKQNNYTFNPVILNPSEIEDANTSILEDYSTNTLTRFIVSNVESNDQFLRNLTNFTSIDIEDLSSEESQSTLDFKTIDEDPTLGFNTHQVYYLTSFVANLINDSYSDSFLTDFKNYFDIKLRATGVYPKFSKFIEQNKIKFQNPPQESGAYDVSIFIKFSTDAPWELVDREENPIAEIIVTFEKSSSPSIPLDNPLYHLPFDGPIHNNQERSDYGVGFTPDSDVISITKASSALSQTSILESNIRGGKYKVALEVLDSFEELNPKYSTSLQAQEEYGRIIGIERGPVTQIKVAPSVFANIFLEAEIQARGQIKYGIGNLSTTQSDNITPENYALLWTLFSSNERADYDEFNKPKYDEYNSDDKTRFYDASFGNTQIVKKRLYRTSIFFKPSSRYIFTVDELSSNNPTIINSQTSSYVLVPDEFAKNVSVTSIADIMSNIENNKFCVTTSNNELKVKWNTEASINKNISDIGVADLISQKDRCLVDGICSPGEDCKNCIEDCGCELSRLDHVVEATCVRSGTYDDDSVRYTCGFQCPSLSSTAYGTYSDPRIPQTGYPNYPGLIQSQSPYGILPQSSASTFGQSGLCNPFEKEQDDSLYELVSSTSGYSCKVKETGGSKASSILSSLLDVTLCGTIDSAFQGLFGKKSYDNKKKQETKSKVCEANDKEYKQNELACVGEEKSALIKKCLAGGNWQIVEPPKRCNPNSDFPLKEMCGATDHNGLKCNADNSAVMKCDDGKEVEEKKCSPTAETCSVTGKNKAECVAQCEPGERKVDLDDPKKYQECENGKFKTKESTVEVGLKEAPSTAKDSCTLKVGTKEVVLKIGETVCVNENIAPLTGIGPNVIACVGRNPSNPSSSIISYKCPSGLCTKTLVKGKSYIGCTVGQDRIKTKRCNPDGKTITEVVYNDQALINVLNTNDPQLISSVVSKLTNPSLLGSKKQTVTVCANGCVQVGLDARCR